jgi:hypothetical protein
LFSRRRRLGLEVETDCCGTELEHCDRVLLLLRLEALLSLFDTGLAAGEPCASLRATAVLARMVSIWVHSRQ